MIVNLSNLTSAMGKVQSFAQDIKKVPGVMLNIGDNNIRVCYSDMGNRSIIEEIDAVMSNEEQLGEIIVDYKLFMSIIDACQPSGNVLCDNLTITIKDENIMSVEAVKYVKIPREDSKETDSKPVSKFKQEIRFSRPSDDTIKYGILSRMDYESIFENNGADSWDKDTLVDMLNVLNKEDGKVCYFSSQFKAAFVANLAHLSYIPSDDIVEFGFSVNTKMARSLVDIINKIPDDKLNITVEDTRYCKITTEDNKIGIWFEMAPANRLDPNTLASYKGRQYGDYRIVINRPALQDVVKRAISADSADTTAITFKDTDKDLIVNIVNGGSASKLNDFSVIAEKYSGDTGKMLKAELPVSLKTVSDILDKCYGDYIILDVDDGDNGKCMRFTDASGQQDDGEPIAWAYHYTLATK